LAQLPLLANGKIDRGALVRDAALQWVELEHAPPRTGTETALSTIWAEVLGIGPVGARDNFFELGGTSMLAMRVLSRVAAKWEIELTIGDLAENPTPELLAEAIERHLRAG
jgi:hypothetical protein